MAESIWTRPLFRRNPKSLVAAGRRIDIGNYEAVKAVLKNRQKWQDQAFDIYDAVGEVHMAVNILASLMSRLNLYPAKTPGRQDSIPEATTDKIAVEALDRLGSVTDRAEIQHDLTVQLVVPGEGNLLGIQPGDNRKNEDEVWDIVSMFEMEQKDDDVVIQGYYEDGTDLILKKDSGDTWIRIWRRHPRKRQEADSHVRAILGAADELLWWDAAAISRAKSRLSDSGIIAIPSSFELPAETEEEAGLTGNQRYIKKLQDYSMRSITVIAAAESVVPFVTSYPANERGESGIEYITIDRPQDELLEKRSDRALRRIAQGLNIPVEDIFGLSEATRWGGGQIAESKFREHLEPLAVLIVNALTNAYYRPTLRAMGVKNANDYLIWYDASNLITFPDRATQSNRGLELGAIDWPAWRRANGYSDADEPTPEEREEIRVWMSSIRSGTQNQGIVETPQKPEDPNDPAEIPKDNPPDRRTPTEQPAAPLRRKGQSPVAASANGHPPLGNRLAEIDSDLLSRVQVMCDSSMRRALEKAGNKLRTRARKNTTLRNSLRNVAAEDVAATLGRQAVIALGMDDLFDDTFDTVPHLFSRWVDASFDAALGLVGLDPAVKDRAPFAITACVDEAAQSLTHDLKELATILLFDRALNLGPAPESDDLLIPARIVRKALSRAGGSSLEAQPNLLVATGRAVSKVLAESGHFVSTHRWHYGASPRNPYTAHQSLDGTEFQIDIHPSQPGDTDACRCVAIPVFKE